MFNALEYIKELEAVGFRREQAEAQVRLAIGTIEENVATKTDIAELRTATKSDFLTFQAATQSDMVKLRDELKTEMTELRDELKTEMTELRDELKTEMSGLRDDMKEMRSRFAMVDAEFVKIWNRFEVLETKIVFKLSLVAVSCATIATAVLGVLIRFK